VTGIRPGEKLHEILISEEEAHRTGKRGEHYVIGPILPELQEKSPLSQALDKEYSSADDLLTPTEVKELLRKRHLMIEDTLELEGEFLR
jgi:UDP-glucose 4-epimerase